MVISLKVGEIVDAANLPPEGEMAGRPEGGAKELTSRDWRLCPAHTFPTIAKTYQITVTASRTIFLEL